MRCASCLGWARRDGEGASDAMLGDGADPAAGGLLGRQHDAQFQPLARFRAADTMASTQMPLSMPPGLAMRPARPGAIAPNRDDAQPVEQAAGSAGQDALVQAAGPASSSDIRTAINENSGLVYPDPGFVDRLMNWSAAAWLHAGYHAGAQGRVVQPDVLSGVASARTSAGECPRARRSRRVAARSRFASRRPVASVSSSWCA